MKLNNKNYSRKELLKYTGNRAQLGGTRHYQLTEGKANGVKAVDFNTGTGFNFTVLPDRGLDIAGASYQGINLVYLTASGEVNPAFYEPQGMGWLRSFFGGLLTTCGLTYLGPPCEDEGEELGIHGRYSHIPARKVNDNCRWQGDEYLMEVSGIIEECSLFGNKLRLKRTISSKIGSKSLKIKDTVENFGFNKSPFTILYHMNAGFPLLSETGRFIISAQKTEPADEISSQGRDDLNRFSSPENNFQEQNFHHIMKGDSDNYGYVALINHDIGEGLGLYLKFKLDNLPYLNQWKMMGEGEYVLGMEPCNVRCESRNILREKGELPYLAPGEDREMEIEAGIIEGQEEIEQFVNMVEKI